jgi:hypothetical protein
MKIIIVGFIYSVLAGSFSVQKQYTCESVPNDHSVKVRIYTLDNGLRMCSPKYAIHQTKPKLI